VSIIVSKGAVSYVVSAVASVSVVDLVVSVTVVTGVVITEVSVSFGAVVGRLLSAGSPAGMLQAQSADMVIADERISDTVLDILLNILCSR
jgi:hypothetical protein